MAERTSIGMRLAPDVIEVLEHLATNMHISKTQVVERAVREMVARFNTTQTESCSQNGNMLPDAITMPSIAILETGINKTHSALNETHSTLSPFVYRFMSEVDQRLSAIEARQAQCSASNDDTAK